MKQSIQSVFLALAVLTVLLSGCVPGSTSSLSAVTPLPTNTPIPPTKPPIHLTTVPKDTPAPTPTQAPWKVIKSVVTKEENPIEQQNVSNYWQILTLTRNLKVSGALEMKLNMESIGTNIMVLTHTEGGGEPWWKGTKRMEIDCEEGTLGVQLRDGSAEEMVFSNDNRRPPMPSSSGATICQITVKFDQYAKKIQILQDNTAIFLSPQKRWEIFKEVYFLMGQF